MAPKSEVRRHLLSRREFVSLSAVGATLPWLGGLALAAPAETALAAKVEPLSVGYLVGTDQLSLHYDHLKWSIPQKMSAAEPGTVAVLSAAGLGLGDQRLAGGDVKLTVHGIYPANPADCRGVEELDLDVLFPPPDPAVPVPARFMAWSYRRRPGFSPSPPVSFRVPLGTDGRLDITLRAVYQGDGKKLSERLIGSPLVKKQYQTSFTADWQPGRPKLQRGVYVLGVRPGIWDADLDLPGAKQKAQAAALCSVVVSVEPIAAE